MLIAQSPQSDQHWWPGHGAHAVCALARSARTARLGRPFRDLSLTVVVGVQFTHMHAWRACIDHCQVATRRPARGFDRFAAAIYRCLCAPDRSRFIFTASSQCGSEYIFCWAVTSARIHPCFRLGAPASSYHVVWLVHAPYRTAGVGRAWDRMGVCMGAVYS